MYIYIIYLIYIHLHIYIYIHIYTIPIIYNNNIYTYIYNTKRGGVCLYYKNNLPLRVINIGYLNECLTLELTIGDKICNFVVLYRSPSQSQDDFETFSSNFEMTLDILAQKNPFLMTTIGDFNAKSKNWYSQNKTSFEGKTIESITSQFGLYQLINEPTHLLENSSSCIDLIFTSQPNLVVESGVHPSLHPNCHHQIVFAKFNLMISYPPPYSREVWHYREANTDLIRRAISNFNWEKAFCNTSVNKKVSIFNETILNILSNYIPHETLICDDRDLHGVTLGLNLFCRIKISFTKISEGVTMPSYLIN